MEKYFHWCAAISSEGDTATWKWEERRVGCCCCKIRFFFSPPSPPILAAGCRPPVGVTLSCLRARRGQRWRARGRRWRTRWWRSESPTSPSPRGEGSPSPRRRSWPVLDEEEQVGAKKERGEKEREWEWERESLTNCHIVMSVSGANRRTFLHHLLITCSHSHCDWWHFWQCIQKTYKENISLYSFPMKNTFPTISNDKVFDSKVFLKDAFAQRRAPAGKWQKLKLSEFQKVAAFFWH